MSTYYKDNIVFLSEALQSVLDQSYSPKECIVVCDGPLGENAYNLLEEFSQAFNLKGIYLNLIKLPVNVGLGRALKIGVELCQEEYVVRMDSDDISVKNRLLQLKQTILENPDVSVIGTYVEEFENIPGDLNIVRQVPLSNEDIKQYACWRNPINHVSVCFKKSVIVNNGSYEHVMWHEDYFLWLKLLSRDIKFKNLPFNHVYVRVEGFADRRRGIKYLKSEIAFIVKVYKDKYMSTLSCVLYLIPRLMLRLLPSRVLIAIYKRLLRTDKVMLEGYK